MPNIGSRGADLQEGEVITLFASAARGASAGTSGTAVYLAGERLLYVFLLSVTAAATEVTDTLDVYIDWSIDGTTYYNGGHFTQCLGNGGAKKFYAIFSPSGPGTADVDVTTDQAVATFVPSVFGPYVRGRYVEVDAGGAASSFTFSLTGYAI